MGLCQGRTCSWGRSWSHSSSFPFSEVVPRRLEDGWFRLGLQTNHPQEGRAMAGRAGCWAIKPIIPACPWGPHIKRLPHYISISADHPPNAVLPTESSGLQLPGPTWCQGSIQTWMATLCLYRHSRPPPPPPSPGGSGPELTLTCRRGDIALQPWQAQDQKKSKEGYHFQ